MKRLLFIPLLILLTTFSQIKIHRNYSVDEGLVQAQVDAIFQDSKGYMWFGTMGGVSRWDGKNFTNFETRDGLAASQIYDIAETKDGRILIACYAGGLSVYDAGEIKSYTVEDGLSTKWISVITIDQNGKIYLSGYDGVLNIFDQGKITHNKLTSEQPFEGSVYDSYVTNDNEIYFATFGHGVYKLFNNNITQITTAEGLVNNEVWSIDEDNKGNLYIATSGGVSIKKGNDFVNITSKDGLPADKTYSVVVDENNRVYAGTVKGLAVIENEKVIDIITKENGLSSNEIWGMGLDDNGAIYIGTSSTGFDIYNHDKIETYTTENGLLHNDTWEILNIGKEIYFATDAGISILNKKTNSFSSISKRDGLISNSVRRFAKGADGTLYVGTWGGISVIENGRVKSYSAKNGLVHNHVMDLELDSDGDLYVATQGGLSVFDGNSFQNFTDENGLPENYLQSLMFSTDGTMYVGTFGNGLLKMKEDKLDTLTIEDGLSGNNITCISEYNGKILIGTYEGGLNILDDDSIQVIDYEDGLTNNYIHSINIDNKGRVYLSTTRGVNILESLESENVYKTIRESDGLIDDESNRGAVIIDDDYLWFGSAFGVTKYNLDYVDKTVSSPNTFVTQIQIFDKPIAVDSFKSVSAFDYNQNFIQFEFTAVELESPDKVTYRYRLNGLEEDWNFSKRSFVQYTNLDPGEYTFEVSASNESKEWSKAQRLSFVIDPPFWLTWWFIAGAVILVLAVIIYLVTYRLRQLLALERIRSKISADLHDSVGSGLSEISIMSEMMKLKSSKENKEMKKGLEEISDISRDLIKDMSDIVWLVNPKKESFEELLLRLNDHYQDLLSHKEINYEIDNLYLAEDISLQIDTRRNLFLLIKEAVNNAAKYSDCGNITIKVNREGKLISIEIIDDGKGFDIDKVKKGNGIINIKNRAKAIGGNAEIISEVGKGTTVIVKFKQK